MERTKTKNVRFNYIYPEARALLPRVIHPLSFVFTHGVKVKRPYSKPFLNKIYRQALNAFNEAHATNLDIELYEATKHSFGTEQVNKGVPIQWIQQWFGHTSQKMTEKYAKLNVVDVFRKLNNVVSLDQVRKKDSENPK
jgi:integrase